ncbi:MAG: outer membrane protein assembly factor BamA [Crocinitomicaceae bacterium]|nr:outer membrane protein assembly factor BamA [Crocinitomicaceae bacterium]|tara:strand:- start:21255 stop:23792 length:2538 start_codon:yes stop_codon:yes gene_type:complete
MRGISSHIQVFLLALLVAPLLGQSQTSEPILDLSIPQNYRVAGLTVLGAEYTDVQAVKLFSALQVGNTITIPGEEIPRAIRNLWDQDLFSDIQIEVAELRESDIYLIINVKELPRLTRYSIYGVNRSEQETIRETIDLMTGRIVNENVVATATKRIKEYYIDKGYLDIGVDIIQELDSSFENGTIVRVRIDKGDKVKIGQINLEGVTALELKKLKRKMKNTKEKRWWRFYKSSKYIDASFKEDQAAIISEYNRLGYRNARIIQDSLYRTEEGLVGLDITIEEGNQFHFGEISFAGNAKYRTSFLDSLLGINKGDLYNLEHLENRVFMDPKGLDLSSLYQDDGYLTFRAMPIEKSVDNDTIDIEIRMMEGQQFRIGRVSVQGNVKTNDHVIYREIRTRPGELFSRTDVIRTQRELAQLNYFNPESFGVNPIQNPAEGTVDIEYTLEEKPSDQIEVSGGWGGGRVVGSLSLSFTNFSAKRMFEKGAWKPIPTGDGQRLSIIARSNGLFFQNINLGFTEPWLGGKKPNSLSTRIWKTVQSNGQPKKTEDGEPNPNRQSFNIIGAEVRLGQRLKKPDDWFLLSTMISYQHFDLNDYGQFFSFDNGQSNNLAAEVKLSRNSISDPIFPVWGSNVEVNIKATVPYSLFRDDGYYDGLTDEERYKWLEYHKWKLKAEWYTPLTSTAGENPKSLVLKLAAGIGIIGQYDRAVGLSPFERFYMGGVFLSGFAMDGREILNLRGYDDLSLTAPDQQTGAPVAAKYTAELRYPLSTNPNATIYMLGFLEAGKTWEDSRAFNPFEVYKSGGVGLRIFLPMFGLLGLDYGWRMDDVDAFPSMSRGQFHFSMGMGMGEL